MTIDVDEMYREWAETGWVAVFYDPAKGDIPGVKWVVLPNGTLDRSTQDALTRYTDKRIRRDMAELGYTVDVIDGWLKLQNDLVWKVRRDGTMWTVMVMPTIHLAVQQSDTPTNRWTINMSGVISVVGMTMYMTGGFLYYDPWCKDHKTMPVLMMYMAIAMTILMT